MTYDIPAIEPLSQEQTEEALRVLLKTMKVDKSVVDHLNETGTKILQLALDLGFIEFDATKIDKGCKN